MHGIGPKEAALRELRAQPRAKHHQMMIDDGCPPQLIRTTGKPPTIPKRNVVDSGVTLAPPLAVQKAIAAEFSEPPTDQPKAEATPTPEQQESEMGSVKSKSKKSGKKTAAEKTSSPMRTKSNGANGSNGARAGSKVEIIAGLLKRPEGCTTADVLKITGWPSVSMPAQAKAAGLTLQKEKDGSVTRYRAA